VKLYLHSPIRLHCVVLSLKKAQGQLYFYLCPLVVPVTATSQDWNALELRSPGSLADIQKFYSWSLSPAPREFPVRIMDDFCYVPQLHGIRPNGLFCPHWILLRQFIFYRSMFYHHTLCSEIHKLLRSIWNKENFHSSGRNLLLYQFTKRVVRLTVIIIQEYHSYQLPTKFYPKFFCPG
jgi:hypothetical protein